MRILIIEDNRLIAHSLQNGLQPSYAVDVASTGETGLVQASTVVYDLVLLDLNLPDTDGLTVCRQLRHNELTSPIIIITGSTQLTDKIKLLDSGADDYITKPFRLEEVTARIRAALRRPLIQSTSTVLIAPGLELDPAAHTVKRYDHMIELRRKEFDILEYLLRNSGKTVTRSMIIEHTWDMNENLWANVVNVHIKNLRDKIDRPFGSSLIKTVHGVGYKIEVLGSEEATLQKEI